MIKSVQKIIWGLSMVSFKLKYSIYNLKNVSQQVQNMNPSYQSSHPSASQQTGQNVQTMHVTQPTVYNGQ